MCVVFVQSRALQQGLAPVWKARAGQSAASPVCLVTAGVAGPRPHHGPGVCTAMPLRQVPQVDRQLVQLVVAQVSVGQDAVEEGEAQCALPLQGLGEREGARMG